MGEKFYFVFLDDEQLNLLRFWIHTDNGRVVNFVVQYETFIKSEWHAVVRYDLAHNFFHRDIMNYKGEKEKYSLPIQNLKDANKSEKNTFRLIPSNFRNSYPGFLLFSLFSLNVFLL